MHTKIRFTNKHEVTDCPFKYLQGTAELAASQGELTVKMGLNPDLKVVENHREKRKVLITKLQLNKKFHIFWLTKPKSKHTHRELGKTVE